MMDLQHEVLQAFRLIDERLVQGPSDLTVRSLRRRLLGELLGDADLVSSTLAPDFVLTMHAGDQAATTSASSMIAGIRRQGEAGVSIWMTLDDLVVELDVIAGNGLLHTFSAGAGKLSTLPLAFFIRFAGDRMTSEVAYMHATAARFSSPPEGAMPSVERLRSLLS